MRILKQLLTFIGAFALVLTACGGTSDDTTAAEPTNAPEATSDDSSAVEATTTPNPTAAAASAVSWMFDGQDWSASGEPPPCPDPIELDPPIDLTLATAVLYPGQSRGGNYKAHGGFLFDGHANTDVVVQLPMDASLVRGSRYIEMGEVQYLLDFIAPCGIMFRFDHLLTLAPDFATLADQLPEPTDSSATQNFDAPPFAAGTEIATAVGFTAGPVSVDWGVYDLRTRNAYSGDANPELIAHAVCWLDLLGADSATVRALPPGDGEAGATSAYC